MLLLSFIVVCWKFYGITLATLFPSIGYIFSVEIFLYWIKLNVANHSVNIPCVSNVELVLHLRKYIY